MAPSAGVMTIRPLHLSPRLSELMQRSPLPTILGSPSRVRECACVLLFEMWETTFDPVSRSCPPPQTIPPFEFPKPPSSPNLVNVLTQQGLVVGSPVSRTGPLEPRDPLRCVHGRHDDSRGFGR